MAIQLPTSTELLKELKQIVNSSSLSLNDKERMDIIDCMYLKSKVPQFGSLFYE
jgi:hypothetical protein